jgi:predicted nucleotide-binding protein (sugar kinase/HSP70/actin superfamily)
MKNKITIGIPKSLLYYRYNILWTTYLKKLNCDIVYSPDTNKQIIELGKKYSIDESCLSSKIYLGHIAMLQNKCDYILVPRISNYGQKEKVCVKFNATYDIIHNQFLEQKILDYNIETTTHQTEALSLIKLGLKLNKNIIKVIKSYYQAKKYEKKYYKKLMTDQNKKLNSDKLKILVVSHPYNIYDKYIGYPIINFLNSMDVEIIYADRLDKKIAKTYGEKLSPTLYWTYSKELIGAIEYYKYSVDGIIFLTTFPCGPDSLVNELMIRKEKDIPITNILIDDSTAEAGIQTRLESFIDIIKGKKDNND